MKNHNDHEQASNLVLALEKAGLIIELLQPESITGSGFTCTRSIASEVSVLVTDCSPYDFDNIPQTVRDILADLKLAEG